MMLGLNKNMNHLNTLYDQMNSLKKIQRPSDDPIILGRSLKLRLNVLETEQYKTNVGEAKSWMEVSENSINNTHAIFNDIRYQYTQAANGPLGVSDREKIAETVKQLKNQLVQESNANYAGRNVFAGYKTDKKVLFDENKTFEAPEGPIEFRQEFGQKNVETVTYREEEYHRIRLPYGDIDGADAKFTTDPDPAPDLDVIYIDSTDNPASADPALDPPVESYYHPAPGKAYFMKDTGELILNKEDAKKIEDITIVYTKSEFKVGDPNPEVFFEVEPPIYTGPKDSKKIEYEIGIGTKLDINVLGKDLFDPLALRDIDEILRVLESYEGIEEEVTGDDSTRSVKETINLSKLFSNGIGKMDDALKKVSSQQADLGSRMMRLDLTEKRLGDDEISYTDLLSRTEDVELERAFIDFNTQYAVYQSALQVTAKVVQPTLMDFLR